MLFSSLTFLFAFLPITIILYYLSKDKYKNYILLIASLFFYAWGEPKYIILMLLSIIANYYFALFISKPSFSRFRKPILVLSIIFNIGALFLFKYLDFAIFNFNQLFSTGIKTFNLALPIGISFYTFQILSYVIDVYSGRVKVQRNIFTLGTYIALFPQLIAGPIVRYLDIEKQLQHRKHTFKNFCDGFRRFLVGFIKKILIANNVAVIADAVFNNPTSIRLHPLVILLALLAYTLQIYFDFSGYSDMAIGLGKIFGFDFNENFNYPYSATSITDFWKRWHISLTTWFKDYLYIPLGGNRCSKLKWIRNFFIVWFLTGLWHGSSWNFILWGLFYAFILLFEKLFLHKLLVKLPRLICWLYTFIVVNIGWLLFRANNFGDLKYLTQSFFHPTATITDFFSNHFSIMPYFVFMLTGLIFMFPIARFIKKKTAKSAPLCIILDLILILLFIISILALINSSYNPFIYFRF